MTCRTGQLARDEGRVNVVRATRRRENMVGVNMVLADFIQFWELYARTMFTPTMCSRGRVTGMCVDTKCMCTPSFALLMKLL